MIFRDSRRSALKEQIKERRAPKPEDPLTKKISVYF